jgi:hypothetical protein
MRPKWTCRHCYSPLCLMHMRLAAAAGSERVSPCLFHGVLQRHSVACRHRHYSPVGRGTSNTMSTSSSDSS